jgi:uncharacterized membrane protein
MLLPILVFVLVVAGFVLGLLMPNLRPTFYIVFVLAGGTLVLIVDRLSRHTVNEAVTDERIQSMAEQAAFFSYKITFATVLIVALVLINALPNIEGARLVGVGACCAIGLQSMIYVLSYSIIRRRQL